MKFRIITRDLELWAHVITCIVTRDLELQSHVITCIITRDLEPRLELPMVEDCES